MTAEDKLSERYGVSHADIYKFTNVAGIDWYIIDSKESYLKHGEAILVRGEEIANDVYRETTFFIGDWPPPKKDLDRAMRVTAKWDLRGII